MRTILVATRSWRTPREPFNGYPYGGNVKTCLGRQATFPTMMT